VSLEGRSFQKPVVYRFRSETFGGTGRFTVSDTISGQFGASGIAAGDWDGDSDIDLAVANFSANNIGSLENDGTGSFSEKDTIANHSVPKP
jgi:hypothetical protein